MTVDFDKNNYWPGEKAIAKIKVKGDNKTVSYSVFDQADTIELNAQGEANVTFEVPKNTKLE